MGRFDRRIGQGQRDNPLNHLGAKGRDTRRTRLVAEKAIDAFLHEPLSPTPDTGLGLLGPTHDFRRAHAVGAQENDGRPPHMFLGGIAVPDRPFKTKAVSGLTVNDIPVRMCQTRTCAILWASQNRLFC